MNIVSQELSSRVSKSPYLHPSYGTTCTVKHLYSVKQNNILTSPKKAQILMVKRLDRQTLYRKLYKELCLVFS